MARDKGQRTKDPVVRRRPSIDFSLNGWAFLGLTGFMLLAAINSQANLLFGVAGLMTGVMLVSISISRLVLMRLKMMRVMPDHAVVGRRVTLQYEITNQKKYWPSLSVTVAELDGAEAFTRQPLAYMLHAAPGTTAVIGTELIPKRRGLHTFERYQVSTAFPFGFVKRAMMRQQKDTLLVYPAIGQVDPKLLLRFQAAERSGAMLRPRRGGNDEFYGVKEFRRGENPRWIHWKRSARTGTLVAKEMTLVSPPRLLLLVDTCLPGPADRTREVKSRIEQTIAMAGSLASHALEAGLMVGLVAWSDGWLTLQPNRGKRHARDLMAALARLPRNTAYPAQALLDRSEELTKSGTTPVLLTPREVEIGLSERARGGMVILSPATPTGRAAFKFDPAIEF
jgi:uncharacterized protein (DUF58 family)